MKKFGKMVSADDLKTMIKAMDDNGNTILQSISNKMLAIKCHKLNF